MLDLEGAADLGCKRAPDGTVYQRLVTSHEHFGSCDWIHLMGSDAIAQSRGRSHMTWNYTAILL